MLSVPSLYYLTNGTVHILLLSSFQKSIDKISVFNEFTTSIKIHYELKTWHSVTECDKHYLN